MTLSSHVTCYNGCSYKYNLEVCIVQNQYQIFNLISLLAGAFNLVLAMVALGYRRRSPEALYLGLLMLATSIWSGAIGIQMLQVTIQAARMWLTIRMAGVVMVPVFWLLFALQFSGIKIKSYQKLLLGVIPAVSYVLFLTRGFHTWFISRIQFSEIQGYMIDLSWTLGPLYWIHFVFGYLLMIVGAYFIVQKAIQLRQYYRKQAVVLALGVLVPLAINFSAYFDLFPKVHVNYDPLGFLFAGLALTYALSQLRLFDLLPIAQEMLIDSMRDGMLVLDLNHRVVDFNPAAGEILDTGSEDLIGRSLGGLSPLATPLIEFLDSTTSGQTEISVGEDEFKTIYLVELNPLNRDGREVGKLLILKDITEQRKREHTLWEDASRDHLTGVYNRRYLSEVGSREFQRAARHGHPLSLILFDLDQFKQVNDTFGHIAGDILLKKVAEICRKATRQEDILARYGGDEFVVLCLDTDEEGALNLAERVRTEIASMTVSYQGELLDATASLGVTSLQDGEPGSMLDLVRQADKALYEAKRGGKNRVCSWNKSSLSPVVNS